MVQILLSTLRVFLSENASESDSQQHRSFQVNYLPRMWFKLCWRAYINTIFVFNTFFEFLIEVFFNSLSGRFLAQNTMQI